MMDFYNQKHAKARKSHKCEFCGKEIIPGETYSYEIGKFDGEFFVRKLCEPCFTMLDEFIDYTGEDEFQWYWIQEWLHDEYCTDECLKTCEYGFSKVQCCPNVREKFNSLLEERRKHDNRRSN